MELAKSFTSPPHRRPAKIRQSCDSCGISKIKCGRQRPHCQSCLERGLACSYTPSRRSAKYHAASSEGGTWSYTEISARSPPYHAQHVTAAEPSSSWSEAVTDTRACQNDNPAFDVMAVKKSSLGFPADLDTQGHGTSGQKLPVIPGCEYDLNEDLDFNALCGSPTPSALLACMRDELSDADLEHDVTASTQKADDLSIEMSDHFSGIFSPVPDYRSETRNPQGRLRGIESCSNHSRTCMVSALKILQALHMPPSICLSAGAEISESSSRLPRMTDSVLSTNRETVRLVSDMLKCTCSLSSQVQLVLIIICDKLTAWYRAMVRNGYDGFDNPSSLVWSVANNNNNNVKHEEHTERVLHQPITVGEYSLDVTLDNQIRAQVVFSELQHVEGLIERLSRRVEETKFGNLWNAAAAKSGSGSPASSRLVKANETGLAEAIPRSLTMFLHKQLQAAKAEISHMLNGGHGSTCASGQSSDLDG